APSAGAAHFVAHSRSRSSGLRGRRRTTSRSWHAMREGMYRAKRRGLAALRAKGWPTAAVRPRLLPQKRTARPGAGGGRVVRRLTRAGARPVLAANVDVLRGGRDVRARGRDASEA